MVGWGAAGARCAGDLRLPQRPNRALLAPGLQLSHLVRGGLFVGALALLPAIAVTDSWWAFPSGIGVGEWALIGSTLIVAVSSLLFFEVVRRAGAVFASTGTYIEALAAIGWGILLFDERHSAWIWASVAALMVGLYLVNRSGRNRAPPGV